MNSELQEHQRSDMEENTHIGFQEPGLNNIINATAEEEKVPHIATTNNKIRLIAEDPNIPNE